MKRYMIQHAHGGSSCVYSGLTQYTGPFDGPTEAASWAFRKWGPASNSITVTWAVRPLEVPEER